MTPALLPVLILVVLVGGIWLPARVTVLVEDGELHVRLGPLDRVFCMSRQLRFPVETVSSVSAAAKGDVPRTGLRLPGTSLPGVIRAGSFGTGDSRDFWDVRRGKELLVVQLKAGAGYRKLVLEVADPQGEAERLTTALGSTKA